jgi:phosphonate transport system permease protein
MAFASTLVGCSSGSRSASRARATSRQGGVPLGARVIVVGRTFHEVIIAIFFVKLFGFGPSRAFSRWRSRR